jgi:subtilisin family serine protease
LEKVRWKANAGAFGGGDVNDVADVDANGRLDPASGHGMFIAGVISQYAPGTAVRVLKALEPEGDGDEQMIVDKIDEAIALQPDILNLSFGTYTLDDPKALKEAIQAAFNAGIIVVAAAGNDGVCRPQYPAAFPGVISVGALGPNGPAPFSNWGEWVRASALGVDVVSGFWEFDGRSVDPTLDDPELFEQWAMWSGTSFAAPIVVAALAREIRFAKFGDLQKHRKKLRAAAVDRVVDQPGLYRIPCYGAVVNPGSTLRAP